MSQINRFNGDYIFLSNFYPVEVEYNGILYPSVEHAYQAQKTLNEDIRLDFSKINKDRACDAKKKSYSDSPQKAYFCSKRRVKSGATHSFLCMEQAGYSEPR